MKPKPIPGVVRVHAPAYEHDRFVGNVEVGLAIVDIELFYRHACDHIDMVEMRRIWCLRNPKP